MPNINTDDKRQRQRQQERRQQITEILNKVEQIHNPQILLCNVLLSDYCIAIISHFYCIDLTKFYCSSVAISITSCPVLAYYPDYPCWQYLVFEFKQAIHLARYEFGNPIKDNEKHVIVSPFAIF